MKIYLGSDHRGFELKNKLKEWLSASGHQVEDLGAHAHNPNDDYPDYAGAVGQQVSKDTDSLGIVLCGSGVGVDVVANKIDGVRSAYAASEEEIKSARQDDNANVLAIGADFTDQEKAQKFVTAFLNTFYTPNERYERRLEEIKKLEKGS